MISYRLLAGPADMHKSHPYSIPVRFDDAKEGAIPGHHDVTVLLEQIQIIVRQSIRFELLLVQLIRQEHLETATLNWTNRGVTVSSQGWPVHSRLHAKVSSTYAELPLCFRNSQPASHLIA